MAKSKTPATKDPAEALKAFCSRRSVYGKLIDSAKVAMTYGIDGGPYQEVLAKLERGATLEDIKELLGRWHQTGVRSPGISDIAAFLATGQGTLPSDALDLAESFRREQAEARKERERLDAETKARLKAEDEKQTEEEQERKRAKLAADLDIKPDVLEWLRQG